MCVCVCVCVCVHVCVCACVIQSLFYDCNLTTLVSQAGQYDVENDKLVVLGTTASVVWVVTDENNYVVTFGGGDPTYDGKQTR